VTLRSKSHFGLVYLLYIWLAIMQNKLALGRIIPIHEHKTFCSVLFSENLYSDVWKINWKRENQTTTEGREIKRQQMSETKRQMGKTERRRS
jgi:hypothetical protein